MTVHFIGAGPGAADLLTLRGAELIRTSQVCLYAGTYIDQVLAHCAPDTERIDTQHLNLDAITEHLVRAHREGKDVTRLCSGDPSIYSAIAEQTRRLDAAGVPWDVTPGVPAYAAAAALLGKELTVPEVAQTVILTRAQKDSTAMPETERLEHLAASRATLALHLAIRHTERLRTQLLPHYGPDCPVAIIGNATQPDQTVIRTTVEDMHEAALGSGLRQAAIILVGEALRAADFVESHLYSSRCAPQR
ncbi:precorrin-4 C(11)-methyltransferase [Arachnia propionica]|uniref:Precorrin-4 C(11)-methyltransferase n=1 Tax=Arachnia propionica TaxID=1750 RepID=A0A3P1T2Q1_9ACTN|nr:precorrin-4 C(11)-methyltransferase [Arachnia propionica]RRD03485.1 precorrin-4 C(11)-methyltransferase [Arachnia propionica]